MTLYEMATPARRVYRFQLMSEPTLLQTRSFELMEIDPASIVPGSSQA